MIGVGAVVILIVSKWVQSMRWLLLIACLMGRSRSWSRPAGQAELAFQEVATAR
ncbi:hypothetical protein [Nonomuraea turkmeniaca]|uniref:hypothetical protein n=1 Tax=Nonomuraea turkmeniaca TaxID=103838 RepID=UPI001476C62C|nr:hypothetical protein [Nonomuraea turkmeniaca]